MSVGGKSKFQKIERRFRHIVEIVIPTNGLDAPTNRAILSFHRVRDIQVRFGHSLKNVGSFAMFAQFSGAPPGSTYIPAHIENGKFVPGTTR